MAAKDVIHGQAGTTGAALLKLLPFCLMILPGVAARVIIDITGKHLSDIMNHHVQISFYSLGETLNYDHAYPFLVRTVVPVNARGIIVASMMASLMSSLASVFNSSSTLVSLNLWKVYHPETTEQVSTNSIYRKYIGVYSTRVVTNRFQRVLSLSAELQ